MHVGSLPLQRLLDQAISSEDSGVQSVLVELLRKHAASLGQDGEVRLWACIEGATQAPPSMSICVHASLVDSMQALEDGCQRSMNLRVSSELIPIPIITCTLGLLATCKLGTNAILAASSPAKSDNYMAKNRNKNRTEGPVYWMLMGTHVSSR